MPRKLPEPNLPERMYDKYWRPSQEEVDASYSKEFNEKFDLHFAKLLEKIRKQRKGE